MEKLIAAVALLLIAGAASADEEYDRCIEQGEGTNQAWAQCGAEWIEREDKKLNETWRKLIDGVSEQTAKDLRAEQRAWNAYKELSCLFHANGDYGREGQVLDFPACRAEVIARRTAELEGYAAGREAQ